ncbi:MAG: amino acid ABC transporter substrate-binding protein [Desulfobulbus propionicus]|nr:MAG: amino acid ABC transporter substrate-binding protein [Desulfobulbus propionicus]PIE64012.1 MAG: amino acid ABC transporter substrate-binding protein [Desulfobacterales bacterium]
MKRPRQSLLSILLFFPFVLLLVGYLVFQEKTRKRPEQIAVTTAGYVEMCLSCHTEEKLDPAHDRLIVGCSPCHLGDALAIEKDKAHRGIVRNPGDLRVVAKTCGVEGCHPSDIGKVKNSLMATNRGILATLLYYWGERETNDADISVEQLLESGETSLALDYYRKLCATCHLWKQKNDLPGAPAFFNEKGGGCSACHYQEAPGDVRETVTDFDGEAGGDVGPDGKKKKPHPLIVKKVPDDNCIRCHNRSGRIGLSYIGVFEAEGYGTPYEKGKLSSRKLPGDRFYLEIGEDVHHAKGMSCIDCHTREEIMGDGTSYAHYEQQLEITCTSCHDANPGTTRKKNHLTNVEREGKNAYLIGKNDRKKRLLNPPKHDVCTYPGHKRITCEACHSTWVPQCYGCHAKRDATQTHLDKLTLEETPGWWEEGRSYIRYEKPMLAIWGDEVVIVTPGCQDIVTLIDDAGEVEGRFNRFTMAAINPHTTQAKGRSCKDCHASPKTIGLGEGTVTKEDGKWQFYPVNKGVDTLDGRTVGLDNFVTIDGKALQYGSREDLRPFNKEEIESILRVGLCLDCHTRYDDPAFVGYERNRPCPVFKEP